MGNNIGELVARLAQDPKAFVDWVAGRAAELEAEEARLKAEFGKLNAFAALFQSYTDTRPAPAVKAGLEPPVNAGSIFPVFDVDVPMPSDTAVPGSYGKSQNTPGKTSKQTSRDTALTARKYIVKAEKPLDIDTLLARFHADGMFFGGVDEGALLRARLTRNGDVLVLVKGSGFWAADLDWPASGYVAPKAAATHDEPDDDDGDPDEELPDFEPPPPVHGSGNGTGSALACVVPGIAYLLPKAEPRQNFGFLDHHAALDENCGCWRCEDWRIRRDTMNRLFAGASGHARNCSCGGCLDFRQAHQRFLASSNRRDLYTEISYHTAKTPELLPYAGQIEDALSRAIAPEAMKDSWAAIYLGRFSIQSWYIKLSKTVSGVACALGFASSGQYLALAAAAA